MKKMMLVIDGMEDITYSELGGQRPLDFAFHLKKMELLPPVTHTPPGRQADSLVCILTLLGVPDKLLPFGRAYMEAIANEIPTAQNDLVLRLNTVGIENGILNSSGKNKILDASILYPIYHLGGYRHLLIVPDGKRYAHSIITYAPHQNIGRPINDLLCGGNKLGKEMAATTLELLAYYKTETYMAWNPSFYTPLPTFADIYGEQGAVITKTDVLIGIAKQLNMDCPNVSNATGDTDTCLKSKLNLALQYANTHNFILLHINGADEASHRLNPIEKAEFIKKIDSEVIEPLMHLLPQDFELIVTSDHATICKTGEHSPIKVSKFRMFL